MEINKLMYCKLKHDQFGVNLDELNKFDNCFWESFFALLMLLLTDPAKIVKLVSEHEVAAQQSASLDCQAEGNPQSTYSWTPCDPQQSVCHESTLKISEVLSDIVYTCNVANSLGDDARNTSVGKLIPANLRVMGYIHVRPFVKDLPAKLVHNFD